MNARNCIISIDPEGWHAPGNWCHDINNCLPWEGDWVPVSCLLAHELSHCAGFGWGEAADYQRNCGDCPEDYILNPNMPFDHF